MKLSFGTTLFALASAAIADECALLKAAAAEMGDTYQFPVGLCCGQIGISCNNLNSTIEKIYFANRSLTGFMSEKLTSLSNLTFLSLSQNKLSGPIPSSISNLTKLQYLELYENSFYGEIPSSFCKLVHLDSFIAYRNGFTGSIPDQIGNLVNLQRLDLSGNYFTGAIPSSFGELIKLQYLSLAHNQLTAIPTSMRNLTSLTTLKLSENQFNTPYPWPSPALAFNTSNCDITGSGICADSDSVAANIPSACSTHPIPVCVGNTTWVLIFGKKSTNLAGYMIALFIFVVIAVIVHQRYYPTTDKPKTSKISYLDGLRGVACVIVSIDHFLQITQPSLIRDTHQTVLDILYDGHMSVTIFFILSGRVLVYAAMKKNAKDIETYAKSILKRPARLAIPVFGGLLLTQILVPFKAYNTFLDMQDLYGCTFCSNIPIAFSSISQFALFFCDFFLGYQMENLSRLYYVGGVIWTIPVELAGSWVIFIMAILTRSIHSPLRRYTVFTFVGLFFWYVESWNLLFLLGLAMSDFCVTYQVAIANFCANIYRSWPTRILLAFCYFAFYTVQLPIFHFIDNWKTVLYFKDPGYPDGVEGSIGSSPGTRWDIPSTPVTIVAFILMIFIEITPIMQSVLSSPVFAFYGKISYGYYLNHPFILQIGIAPILKKLKLESGYSLTGINAVVLPIHIALSTIGGYIFYRLFDIPSIFVGNYLSNSFINISTGRLPEPKSRVYHADEIIEVPN